MSHKFDQLYYVYDCGFRWGPPDLTYPDPLRPEGSKLGVHKIDDIAKVSWGVSIQRRSEPICEVPGCYICQRDRAGELLRYY